MSLYTEGYYQAGAEASRRRGMEGYYEVKNRQRRQNFAAGAALLNIGSTLWETYSSNRELIDFAKGKGLETITSKFTNIFGTPEFIDKNNIPITRTMLEAAMSVEAYRESENLLDVLEVVPTINPGEE